MLHLPQQLLFDCFLEPLSLSLPIASPFSVTLQCHLSFTSHNNYSLHHTYYTSLSYQRYSKHWTRKHQKEGRRRRFKKQCTNTYSTFTNIAYTRSYILTERRRKYDGMKQVDRGTKGNRILYASLPA